MKTHNGYEGGPDGAKCSKCGKWIPPGDDCVLLSPATISEHGSAQTNATTIHGVLHVDCFKNL